MLLQCLTQVVASETLWLTKLKISTIWPFIEKSLPTGFGLSHAFYPWRMWLESTSPRTHRLRMINVSPKCPPKNTGLPREGDKNTGNSFDRYYYVLYQGDGLGVGILELWLARCLLNFLISGELSQFKLYWEVLHSRSGERYYHTAELLNGH